MGTMSVSLHRITAVTPKAATGSSWLEIVGDGGSVGAFMPAERAKAMAEAWAGDAHHARLLADIDARLSEVQPGLDGGYTYRGHWLGCIRGTWIVQQSGGTVASALSLIGALTTIDARIAVANQRARHAARVQDAAVVIGGAE